MRSDNYMVHQKMVYDKYRQEKSDHESFINDKKLSIIKAKKKEFELFETLATVIQKNAKTEVPFTYIFGSSTLID